MTVWVKVPVFISCCFSPFILRFLVAVVAVLVAEFFGTATEEKLGISRISGWLVAEVAVRAS